MSKLLNIRHLTTMVSPSDMSNNEHDDHSSLNLGNESTDDISKEVDVGSANLDQSLEIASPGFKHPLEHPWTLWLVRYHLGDNGYELIQVHTVGFVEDFWAMYHHLMLPSELDNLEGSSDYCLFKDGIRPCWDDEKNSNGGRWRTQLSKEPRKERKKNHANKAWLNVMLFLIGADMKSNLFKHVNGAVFSNRKKTYKFSLWLDDWKIFWSKKTIGLKFHKIVNARKKIVFVKHSEPQEVLLSLP